MTRSVKALAAIVVLFGAAAGISYATSAVTRASTSVLQACANGTNGNLRLVSSPADCRTNENAVAWNVVGPAGTNGVDGKDGADGVSPAVQQLAAGDPACPAGGVSITDAAGHVGTVCNGTNGIDGKDGKDGTPFSGAFTSPDGRFTLTVADTGIQLRGPLSRITLDPTSLDIRADTSLSLHSGLNLLLDGVSSTLKGSQVVLGSTSCAPALRLGDPMFVNVTQAPGTFPVVVTPTSAVVCVG